MRLLAELGVSGGLDTSVFGGFVHSGDEAVHQRVQARRILPQQRHGVVGGVIREHENGTARRGADDVEGDLAAVGVPDEALVHRLIPLK